MESRNTKRIHVLKTRHQFIKTIRIFFDRQGYLEVDTPSVVYYPTIDRHIDAIEVSKGRFLITSPEIQMKMLIADGFTRIYQICHAYREGEEGMWHNPEFPMLEWYRVGATYFDLMDETEDLVVTLASTMNHDLKMPFKRMTVAALFDEKAGWDPFTAWDEERFFKDLVEKIEPKLRTDEALFLYDYPSQLASMAKLSARDKRICERFELYLGGIEIANGYSELQDAAEQRRRFLQENKKREADGKAVYPVDENFIRSLERGLPPCAGIALGIDRLVAYFLGLDGIEDVMAFPENRLR